MALSKRLISTYSHVLKELREEEEKLTIATFENM